MFVREFKHYVMPGDSIECEVDGFDCCATVYFDETSVGESPETRDDGFWPSLDPKSAGYIGPYSKSTLHRHMQRAKEILRAWQAGEWFYCGVAVTVSFEGVSLTGDYDNAILGVECNYPTFTQRDWAACNHYLRQVANELLPEALTAAKARLTKL